MLSVLTILYLAAHFHGMAAAEVPAPGVGVTEGPCNETASRLCYTAADERSEPIRIEDVKAAAEHIRKKVNPGDYNARLTMPARGNGTCAEWLLLLPNTETVLVVAKQLNSKINSSVLLTDLADSIDGGRNSSKTSAAESLIGCGDKGGQMQVRYDPEHPAYHTAEYLAGGNRPYGVLLRLIRDPFDAQQRKTISQIANSPEDPERQL